MMCRATLCTSSYFCTMLASIKSFAVQARGSEVKMKSFISIKPHDVNMNRFLLAALYLLLTLAWSNGRGGKVSGFSPSAVKSVHTKASPRPTAFANTSFKHIQKTSPQSPVLLKFTPKDDSEVGDNATFIRPALHNSNFFRALSILYALLFAVYTSSKSPAATTNALNKLGQYLVLPSKAAATIHMLSFGTWFGTVFYTTFVAGITMFKNLPRRTFGSLQSKLFPLYFKLCTGTLALQVNQFLLLANLCVSQNWHCL